MSERQLLKVAVENLGPIRHGEIVIKPLTILIGPNNSGKSYFAQLVYALTKAYHARMPLSVYPLTDSYRTQSNQNLYRYLSNPLRTTPELRIEDLPANYRQDVRESYRSLCNELAPAIDSSLRDYFSFESIGEIVRNSHKVRQMTATVNDTMLSISINHNGDTSYSHSDTVPSVVAVTPNSIAAATFHGPPPDLTDWTRFLAASLWVEMLKLAGVPSQDSYYLPSYRSGLLKTIDLIIRFSLRAFTADFARQFATQANVRPNGILAEFVDDILRQPRGRPQSATDSLEPALSLLESRLLEGMITTGDISKGESVLRYQHRNQEYPVSSVSSMVAEIAPLDILIRRHLVPGDLVIIDEPEAHLHPENQRLIAQVIVRLIRAGLRILCTTHSSLFVHQISNHILASSANSAVLRRLRWTDADLLRTDELSVYLFERKRGATDVTTVPIEEGFGISEQEFLRVVEEIGEESYALETVSAFANGPTE